LQTGDFDYIRDLAVSQVNAGADVLDVNVGVPGLDDVAMMTQAVKLITSWSMCRCAWTRPIRGVGCRLAAAPGKPLVNSVSGERRA